MYVTYFIFSSLLNAFLLTIVAFRSPRSMTNLPIQNDRLLCARQDLEQCQIRIAINGSDTVLDSLKQIKFLPLDYFFFIFFFTTLT